MGEVMIVPFSSPNVCILIACIMHSGRIEFKVVHPPTGEIS